MTKFENLQEEVYYTLLRYSNAIDRMYRHGPECKAAIEQHFGTQHSPMVIDAMKWILSRTEKPVAPENPVETQKVIDKPLEVKDIPA